MTTKYETISIGVKTPEKREELRKRLALLAGKSGLTRLEIIETGLSLVEKLPTGKLSQTRMKK